jgi:2-keto-3-deoxy-L-rhamnonate aldolase RhmA
MPQQFVNPARKRLEAGEFALGVGLRQARTVDIAQAMSTAGMDWLFIDLEHGSMSLDTAVQISVSANSAGISPIVRVPFGQYDMATRALDGGATGIVMPHVDTASQAAEMVERLRYPPAGHRSVGGPMPQLNFRALTMKDATKAVNDNLLLVAMLETPKAILNASEIAAVPGIDVLLIGTSDLSMEMGIPGQVMHEDVQKAYAMASAGCKAHGKWLGMGGVYTDDGIATYSKIGARFILTGNDLSFLMAGVSARAQVVRAMPK